MRTEQAAEGHGDEGRQRHDHAHALAAQGARHAHGRVHHQPDGDGTHAVQRALHGGHVLVVLEQRRQRRRR